MKPHKHAILIHAWADGAKIEYKGYDGLWYPDNDETWEESREYRIKHEPKPDVVRFCRAEGYSLINYDVDVDYKSYHNLKITWDGETGKLKKAEVL